MSSLTTITRFAIFIRFLRFTRITRCTRIARFTRINRFARIAGFTTINRFARFTRITRFTRSTRITRITFLNFPQLFSTFLKQILMQNSHSLLRSSWPIFSLGMTLLSVLYSWWDCGGMKFKTSDRCNLFSCTQHFHFCQWNGKLNDKRLKTYWWDYGGMNGC